MIFDDKDDDDDDVGGGYSLLGEAATVRQSVLSDQDVVRRPPGGISALDQDMSRAGSSATPPLAPWQPVTSSFQLQQHVRADANVYITVQLDCATLLFCSALTIDSTTF